MKLRVLSTLLTMKSAIFIVLITFMFMILNCSSLYEGRRRYGELWESYSDRITFEKGNIYEYSNRTIDLIPFLPQGLLLYESCILIVGSRHYNAEQEEEEKRYVEDTIKQVKSYNKGALKPTSNLANLGSYKIFDF